MRNISAVMMVLAFGGCTTVGTLGIISKSSSDTAAMIKSGRQFKELGSTEGKACKHFILGVLPTGNADIQAAVDDALAHSGGGDALINVTTSNSIYGFIPIYNVYTISCTSVRGIAIKFLAGGDQEPVAPAEKEVARADWKTIPADSSVKIYSKTGGAFIATLIGYDGDYLWISPAAGQKKALLAAEVEKVALLK